MLSKLWLRFPHAFLKVGTTFANGILADKQQ